MKDDQKSSQQLKALFLYHEFVSKEMKNQWITLKKLVEYIDMPPTKQTLHELFKSILWNMYKKDTTRGMTREMLNDVLEVYQIALANTGVNIEFPDADRKSLLSCYQ